MNGVNMCGERAVYPADCNECSYLEAKIDKVADDLDTCCTEVKGRLDTDEANISSIQDRLLQYYTMQQVNELIDNLSNVRVEIVQELPQSGESNVIYFVPSEGAVPETYDEYMYINNEWEKIGSTQIDVSNKVNITDFNRIITQLGAILDTQCGRIATLEDCCDEVQTTLTKAGILDLLGYEETNLTLTDTNGNSVTHTILVKI